MSAPGVDDAPATEIPRARPAGGFSGRLLAAAVAGWTLVSLGVAWIGEAEQRAHALRLLESQGRVFSDHVLLFQGWNARHGGVYVKRGGRLTRLGPGSMIREIEASGYREAGVEAHIASVAPLRAEGAADSWESSALRRLAAGEAQASTLERAPGGRRFRFMRPLDPEGACVRCHVVPRSRAQPGAAGLSVSFPVEPLFLERLWSDALGYAAIWLLGVGFLLALRRVVESRALRLRESEARLQRALRELQIAREEERRSIAREIHDQLGQTLVGLRMQLARGLKPQTETGSAEASGMLEAVDRSLADVRRLTRSLRPLVLDDLGLAAALDWLRRDFEQRTRIRCALSWDDGAQVDADRAIVVFRIVQEALTNAARHSGAGRVAVSVRRDAGALMVNVQDNGRGIAAAGARERSGGGQGLLGMSERAAAFGGSVSVTGAPGRGTCVQARIPLTPVGQEERA